MRLDRRNAVLGGVLVLLAAAYGLGLFARRSPPEPVVVSPFAASVVDHITAGSTELRKGSGGGWEVSIDGSWYPADSARVERFMSILSGLRAGRIASDSASSWKTFQVAPGEASPLTAEAGGKRLVDLSVGESSPAGGVYLRRGASPIVYEVFAGIDSYVSADSSYWSDLKILPGSVSVDTLQTIRVVAHDFSVGGVTVNAGYTLESSVVGGKSAWVVRGRQDKNLDQQKVLSLEAEIIQMVGDRFVTGETSTETGLAQPTASISVTDERGMQWSIEVGRRHGAQFYVKRGDRPYVYLVNEWTLHRALPALDDLLAAPAK